MFSPITIVVILIIGAAAGVVTGIMGGSGVVVVVPALTLLLGFEAQVAIGTSLLINVIAALVTAFVYYRHGNLYVRPALWIALGSVFGAQAGSLFADMIPPLGMSNLFGLFLIPMGILLWVRGIRGAATLANTLTDTATPIMTTRNKLSALALGLFVGIMCGLFGAGGGVMILLILLFVLHYPMHLAVGTSSLIMAITAISGTVGYSIRDNIDIFTALIAGVATVLSAGLGARVANKVSEVTLGRSIGVILAALGIAMIATQYIS
ncbi:MAG: sulfite exporter TauE/SafE family protein [Chloroflexota bacterium]|nr:sulfite exporter TauE/SafE family protein [Chloroflexota bacterium]